MQGVCVAIGWRRWDVCSVWCINHIYVRWLRFGFTECTLHSHAHARTHARIHTHTHRQTHLHRLRRDARFGSNCLRIVAIAIAGSIDPCDVSTRSRTFSLDGGDDDGRHAWNAHLARLIHTRTHAHTRTGFTALPRTRTCMRNQRVRTIRLQTNAK